MFPWIAALVVAAMQAKMQHDAAKASAKAQNAQVERQNQQIFQEQERRASQQRNLLERQKASARAAMGAMGTGNGGSASALMAGLTRDTEGKIADDWATVAPSLRGTTPFNSSADALVRGLELANHAVKTFPKD